MGIEMTVKTPIKSIYFVRRHKVFSNKEFGLEHVGFKRYDDLPYPHMGNVEQVRISIQDPHYLYSFRIYDKIRIEWINVVKNYVDVEEYFIDSMWYQPTVVELSLIKESNGT